MALSQDCIHCTIKRIIFNRDDFFITRCVDEKGNIFSAKGTMPNIREGAAVKMFGDWFEDKKWGRQFTFDYVEEEMPSTVQGMEKYLASALIKGVGPGTAKKIVEKFGENTKDVLDNHPERLLEIEGIAKKKMEMISASWKKNQAVSDLMIYFRQVGITITQGIKIYEMYGDRSKGLIESNPYIITEIDGFGFKTADSIAAKIGFDAEDPRRIEAGILYVMEALAQAQGHCYVPGNVLAKFTCDKLLYIKNYELAEKSIGKLIDNRKLRCDDAGDYYLPKYWYSEDLVSRRLCTLMKTATIAKITPADIKATIQKLDFELATAQKAAVEGAARHRVMIITGGPGTGKTTVTAAITSMYQKKGLEVLLAAPTGRAAKRLSEGNRGMKAQTIHRLLEAQHDGSFLRDRSNPIEGDLLIVDECSMIDIQLMSRLMDAVPDYLPIIFVGDPDQLPSVGPGNVLRDMIDSKVIPTFKLNVVYRQGEESGIVANSDNVNNGRSIDMPSVPAPYGKTPRELAEYIFKSGTETMFCECDEPERTANIINELTDVLTTKGGYSIDDVQVLAPMKEGSAGTKNLNKIIQDRKIPKGKTDYPAFRIGDKVMQIRNNYDKDVFNGDVGFVRKINRIDREMTVEFDKGKYVTYDVSELDELLLAYAITIHKSQGAEFSVVIVPVLTAFYVMLQRTLIYTAFSRAKTKLIVVGQKEAMNIAIGNAKSQNRLTKLSQNLQCPNGSRGAASLLPF